MHRQVDMLLSYSRLRLYLYGHATDMRKGFDGLSGIISGELGQNPVSGDVYIFINKRRDRMKLFVWDGDGFWIFYKRLEKGTFQLPSTIADHASLQLPYDDLLLMLQGIDFENIQRHKRYQEHRLTA